MTEGSHAHIQGLFALPVALAPLLDEIPVGVALLDPDRSIVFMNRALEATLGFSRDEVRGVKCMHVVRANRCPQACPVERLTAESEPVSQEGDIINRSRQKIPVRITSAPVVGLDGDLAGYVETFEDLRLLDQLDQKAGSELRLSHVIGRSPKMERVFQILPVIARTDSSVLITGETGTGKDVIAEAIHHASDRAKGLFIKVNCGALPETLLESELFGHQKGAFTGAVENKPGRFRLAHNGTIYLTEIGDLPFSLQVKLLTFLDDKVVYPLGATKSYNVDVRVIAATHRDLEHMVREGRFRQDLLFRLNVVRLHLPPLRERGDDVHLLMDHFLRALGSKFNQAVRGFSPETRSLLRSYTYPGNVRELRNIVEYAVNVCDGDLIEPRHLPAYLSDLPLRDVGERTGAVVAEGSPPEAKVRNADDDWASAERRMIIEALLKAAGKKSRAAAILGWGRSTLWRKIKQHGIIP